MYKSTVSIDFESPTGRRALRGAINSWLDRILLPSKVLRLYCKSEHQFNKFMVLREKVIFAWYYCHLLAADDYEDCDLPDREVDEFKEKYMRLRRLSDIFAEFLEKNEVVIRRSLKRQIKELEAIPKDEE